MKRFLARLKEDFRECPATMGLSALWVAVFVAMVVIQAGQPGGVTPVKMLLGIRGGHRFGDMTLREIFAGEVWRSVTATFVHYGLLHIGLNLFAMYQIGCLVESWYGTGPLLAIYVLTGGGGNLISAEIRHCLHSDPSITTAGGSTVIMGLVALCAVVGWRARTRIGSYLRNQMVLVLALTVAMGVGFSVAGIPIIDNWGHTGGAIVGALIGLASRGLVRHAKGLLAYSCGWASVAVLTACVVAQVSDNRTEADRNVALRRQQQQTDEAIRRLFRAEQLILRLDEIRQVFRAVVSRRVITRNLMVPERTRRLARALASRANGSNANPKPNTKPGTAAKTPAGASSPSSGKTGQGAGRIEAEQEFYFTVLTAVLRSLNSISGELVVTENSADLHRAREILVATLNEPPTAEEFREFDDRIGAILERVRRERDLARAQSIASATTAPR
jgi:membrane associated rhomboid family serine protease